MSARNASLIRSTTSGISSRGSRCSRAASVTFCSFPIVTATASASVRAARSASARRSSVTSTNCHR